MIPLCASFQTISLSRIVFDDDAYRLRVGRTELPDLRESLARIGMVNAPLLTRRNGNGYAIVCGFARLEAWRELGHAEVEARIADEGIEGEKLLLAAIEDNRFGRGLNTVEQGLALRKLERSRGRDWAIIAGRIVSQMVWLSMAYSLFAWGRPK